MGLLDMLFGRQDDERQRHPQPSRNANDHGVVSRISGPPNADEQAVARYRYMLQTAPPEELEQAHAEAFARLTPEQRRMVLAQMSQEVPDSERAYLQDDPRALARAATRAEIRQPGTMERMFGGAGGNMGGGVGGFGGMGGGMGGMGLGGMMAGSLLASIAGGFIASSIAHSFFGNMANEQGFMQSAEAQNLEGGANSYEEVAGGLDSSADPYGDPGVDSGGDFTDAGGDSGDFGGDFGGEF